MTTARVQGLGPWVQGLGLRIQGLEVRVQCLLVRARGLGPRVQGLLLTVPATAAAVAVHLRVHSGGVMGVGAGGGRAR